MPSLPEKELHKKLVKLLKLYQKTQGFLFYHAKNDVGTRRNKFFYDLAPLGVLPGTPDFCFLLKEGKTAYLEIKTEKGRLSDQQKRFLIRANRLGHPSYVAFGWEDILDKVDHLIKTKPKKIPLMDSKCHPSCKAGSVLWIDGDGKILKKRKPQTTSIFVY